MLGCALAFAVAGASAGAPPALRALLVGGGPDKTHNQVAIESNVRYVNRLLPQSTPRHILFADGDPANEDVQYQDSDNGIHYRAPRLPRLDGPAVLANVQQEISSLAEQSQSQPQSPVLLYFTGHGSPNRRSQFENNHYDLWDGQWLDVKSLATSVDAFPAETQLTVVMVECYSGAFANLLFDNGDPANALTQHRICGFFASVPQRMAAGCTPEVNEENYRDFTGYFFAALSGVDRLGRPVTGADYNHDGKVGMDEAFAYSLIHDDSIDTPVCTSDLFLRHTVSLTNEAAFATAYSDVLKWATASQRAVLEELSKDLDLSGNYRLADAFEAFKGIDVNTERLHDVRLLRFVRVAKSVVLAHHLMDSEDTQAKARYQELLREEAMNPLRGR